MMKLQLNLPPISFVLGPLRPVLGPVPVLQAHSCLQVLQDSLAHHPQIRQSKQRDQLRRVLGQASVAHLDTTLIRQWDEREYRVTVTPDGLYALDGQVFKSLSAAARHITGTRWNGPRFFGLRDGNGDGP